MTTGMAGCAQGDPQCYPGAARPARGCVQRERSSTDGNTDFKGVAQ